MTTALISKDFSSLPLPTNSLDAYIQAANKIPVLSVEDEQTLAKRLQRAGDLDAARQLIMAHLRFVIHIARSYKGYGLPLGDLIQEGNVGLMKAVKRFDPERKVRLVSFAVHWIKAEIHEYVLRNWRIVKVATTKAQRKLFFNLRSSKKQLGWLNQQEAAAIAEDLGVKTKTVFEMESRLSGHDIAFDPGPDNNDDDQDYSPSPAAYLRDTSNDPAVLLENQDWEDQSQQRLAQALDELDDRSKDILRQRWLSDGKSTLQTLADEYGVSAERIRQLEAAAIKKLKTRLAA